MYGGTVQQILSKTFEDRLTQYYDWGEQYIFQGGTIAILGYFLFKISMHVKTVQIEFFAIEIIISIHISCLKKVLPKCENWQKKFLILLTESHFSWTFFALY